MRIEDKEISQYEYIKSFKNYIKALEEMQVQINKTLDSSREALKSLKRLFE